MWWLVCVLVGDFILFLMPAKCPCLHCQWQGARVDFSLHSCQNSISLCYYLSWLMWGLSLLMQLAFPRGASHTHCQFICHLLRNVYLFRSFFHFKLTYLLIDTEVWKRTICTDFVIVSSMVSFLDQGKSEECWKTSIRIY